MTDATGAAGLPNGTGYKLNIIAMRHEWWVRGYCIAMVSDTVPPAAWNRHLRQLEAQDKRERIDEET